MELEIENGGDAPIRCEEVLHTYFKVGDVREIEVRGLEETEYVTIIEDQPRKRQGAEPIRFVGETDRVYVNTVASVSIVDPVLHRRIEIEKSGSRSAVVWNPWIEKSKKMADFVPDEWPGMVCVETGNIGENTLEIAPGSRHITRTIVREEAL
jgi:glucose-6-phosphate 1-epimerase